MLLVWVVVFFYRHYQHFELLLPIIFGCYSFSMESLRGFFSSEFRYPYLFGRGSLASKLLYLLITVRRGLAETARGCVDI